MVIGHAVLEPPVKVINVKVTAVDAAVFTKFGVGMFQKQCPFCQCICENSTFLKLVLILGREENLKHAKAVVDTEAQKRINSPISV